MKTRTFIITLGSILALVVASTAGARMVSENSFQIAKQTGSFHKSSHSKAVTKTNSAKTKTASKRPTYPVTFIYVPGPLTPSPLWVDDCASSGNNCTDQQLCDIWGMNCDQIAATDETGAAATSEQTGTAAA